MRAMVVVGDNDLVVSDVNVHTSYYFGWSREDVVGKHISFLLPEHPTDLPEAPQVLNGRHRTNAKLPVIVQTMRDPMGNLVAWVLTPAPLGPIYDFTFTATAAHALAPKMTVDDVDMKHKRVLVRVDFNVPIDAKTGLVRDDNRIRMTLPTIRKIVADGGKVILMSHLGRPKGKASDKLSLKPVAHKLEELIGQPVTFVPDCLAASSTVSKMKNGDVILLENVRFHAGEDSKDVPARMRMAEQLASYADLFVSDAFGTAHRESASMTGVPRVMGAGIAGYLMQREVVSIRKAMANPQAPVMAIIAGSKVSDKIALLNSLFKVCQVVAIAGAMSFTFLEALGHTVGKSKIERTARYRGRDVELVTVAKDLLKKAQSMNVKILLPVDHACAPEFKDMEPTISNGADVPEGLMALDIGPQTVAKFTAEVSAANTIIWNGPVGVFEFKNFAAGCDSLGAAIANNKECYSLVGGGDTAAATRKHWAGFNHVSTGGGATLELLEGKALPGLCCLTSRAASHL